MAKFHKSGEFLVCALVPNTKERLGMIGTHHIQCAHLIPHNWNEEEVAILMYELLHQLNIVAFHCILQIQKAIEKGFSEIDALKNLEGDELVKSKAEAGWFDKDHAANLLPLSQHVHQQFDSFEWYIDPKVYS